MNLETILNDKELNKMLESYININYSRYKIYVFLEKDEYCQEIYLYLLQHLYKFDENKSCISTYLYKCIATCSLNLARRQKAIKRGGSCNDISLNVPLELEDTHKHEFIEYIQDDTINIENTIIEMDRNLTKYVFEKCKDETTKIILTYILEGYSYKQIGDKLFYSKATIYRKMAELKKALKRDKYFMGEVFSNV